MEMVEQIIPEPYHRGEDWEESEEMKEFIADHVGLSLVEEKKESREDDSWDEKSIEADSYPSYE